MLEEADVTTSGPVPPRPVGPRGATLVEALEIQAGEQPEGEHLILHGEGAGGGDERLSFGELRDGARRAAATLRARGVGPGDNVALMLPTGRGFFYSFLGALWAGAVPVPIYPPVRIDRLEEYARRHAGILRNAQARALVTFREAEPVARLLRPQVPSLKVLARDETLIEGADGALAEPAPRAPEDLALLQYTSGSTGEPKGVMLTHANLVANVAAISAGSDPRPEDVVVSWLPLYHDMGLIGCWLYALCHGLPIVSLSPLAFLRRPKRWLWAFHDYRGTLSPAPNFAYELCLRKIGDRDLEGIDLSSWRMALNGSEPVSLETVERFAARFGPHGFRPEAMTPVYGLAENTVALAFSPLEEAPRFDRVEREPFALERRAVPAAGEDDGALSFVSVGRALPEHELRVVGPDGLPRPERTEGEIEFRGPSATAGYYRNPEATAALFTADGWVRSGDLGYFAEGDLFITGRTKDLIIQAGRNIYPQEVEAAAAEVEGVRRGCVAAFSVPAEKGGGEAMVVVAETREKRPEKRRKMAAAIKKRVAAAVKAAPERVEMVAPHTVPKTPSGKIQRRECAQRLAAGKLTARHAPPWVQVVRLAASGAWRRLRGWVGR